MSKEFDCIKHYFQSPRIDRDDVVVHSGDDCAIVNLPENTSLALSIDTLVSGVHFPEDTPAFDIGHKALAVSLSDLAACGAQPAWVTATLTLPKIDDTWLADFADGFFALAARFQVELIGGDLTRGPLSITVQMHGFVEKNQGLLRTAAKPGDGIFVSGTLGDAAFALDTKHPDCLNRLNRPEPRVDLGLALRGLAHAAIDLSDGLVGDLQHILKQSQVGAVLNVDTLPLSDTLQIQARDKALQYALNGGDDYELCFTAPPEKIEAIALLSKSLDLPITRIGTVTEDLSLTLQDDAGKAYELKQLGFEHF